MECGLTVRWDSGLPELSADQGKECELGQGGLLAHWEDVWLVWGAHKAECRTATRSRGWTAAEEVARESLCGKELLE